MTGQQHATTGTLIALIGAGTRIYYNQPHAVAFGIGCTIGAIMPDIDSPKSLISSFIPFVSTIINRIFGHRKFFHSLSCLVLFDLLFFYIFSQNPFYIQFCIGFTLGYIIHLLQDTMTKGGAMWLFPFSMKKIALTNNKYNANFNWVINIFLIIIFTLLYFTFYFIRFFYN